jgi:transcriptional regulator
MYIPSIHKCKNAEDAITYIKNNSFASLVACSGGKLSCVHLPLLYSKKEGKEFLSGHIALANDLKDALYNKEDLMAIFSEHHSYISSSWYDHVNVPTWNYIAVHIYGRPRVLMHEELLDSINDMVSVYEASSSKPFHTSQMSREELHAHLKGLVGFEIEIDKVEAAWKLSQNRNDKNYYEIIRRLRERNDGLSSYIANEMEKIR